LGGDAERGEAAHQGDAGRLVAIGLLNHLLARRGGEVVDDALARIEDARFDHELLPGEG
jgi:hypothetical protein